MFNEISSAPALKPHHSIALSYLFLLCYSVFHCFLFPQYICCASPFTCISYTTLISRHLHPKSVRDYQYGGLRWPMLKCYQYCDHLCSSWGPKKIVCWLLNVPVTSVCISGTDLLNVTCCHTEIEVAKQTFHLTQSQYTDTGLTSPSDDSLTPGAWQGSHWSANF